MASCFGDLHIWSVKNQASIQDDDIGCFTYHDKNEQASPENLYVNEKAGYTEGRNVTWTLRNKRPDRLRDTLREVEELLSGFRCLRSKWLSRRLLQLILSNGAVLSIVVSIHTGDVDRIFIDKSLVGKLASEAPTDALLTDSYICFVYGDKPKMDYFYFVRKPEADKKIEKIASCEPKLIQVDLPGPVNRRLDRKLVCNLHQDVIVCWWQNQSGEAQPWSPMASDKEKANLVLLTALGPKFEILTCTKTDCEPVGVIYSLLQPLQLLTVEQWTGSGGEVNVNSCVYECSRNKVHKVSVTTVALRSRVLCYDRNLTEDKILVGCTDGSIVLYDEYKKVTHLASSNLIPHSIRWHPSGSVVMVANNRGELQLFDLALSPLKFQLVAENPAPLKTLPLARYLRSPSPLNFMQWSPLVDHPENKMAECNDSLFIMFDRGPMAMLQVYLGVLSNGILSPLSLVNQYLKYRQIDRAISFLSGLNWNLEGQTCYACLSAIINHLLRAPLDADREALLESVLGTFYAPVRPLSEVTVLEYRDPISRLARRFFHHLLRFKRFEKAFLLAVDIGARDLFMDIHYVARDRGETALSEAALRKAEQIETDALVNECVEDDEYTEGSEGSFTDSDEMYDESFAAPSLEPPPRPPRSSNSRYNRYTSEVQPAATRGQLQSRDVHSADRGQHFQGYPPGPWQPRYMDMSEHIVRELESELAAELVDEYTDTLMDEPILTAPQAEGESENPEASETTRSSTTVKVIHFGIV